MLDRKLLTQLLAASFIVFGFLGFVSKPILGIFQVNGVLNIINILTGILALLMSTHIKTVKNFGRVFAAVFGVMTVFGFLAPEGNIFSLFILNQADSVLYLILTLICIYLGYA